MKLVSAKEMLAFDRYVIETLGVPSLLLMENAGRGLAEEILKGVHARSLVVIVCGTGNNGGDGFVAARHLWIAGIKPKVFLLGKSRDLKPDSKIHFQILRKLGLSVVELRGLNPAFEKAVRQSQVVVDALFGVGLNRALGEPFRKVIEFLNASKRRIISADVPSGLDATTGNIWGECIRADKTVTFSFAKRGFYKNTGPQMTGKVVIAPIGVPNFKI